MACCLMIEQAIQGVEEVGMKKKKKQSKRGEIGKRGVKLGTSLPRGAVGVTPRGVC